jgi:hypothetical protein
MKVARHVKGETSSLVLNVDYKVEEEVLEKMADFDGK